MRGKGSEIYAVGLELLKNVDGFDVEGVISYDCYSPYVVKEVKITQDKHYAYLIDYNEMSYDLVLLLEFDNGKEKKMRFGMLASLYILPQGDIKSSGTHLHLLKQELQNYHSKEFFAKMNSNIKGGQNT